MIKLDHLTLRVSNCAISRDWYIHTLGLSKEFEIPGRQVVALQDSEGFTLLLEQSGQQLAAACVLTFQVASVDETYSRLSREGVAFAVSHAKQFWGYGAELRDPDGYPVRLWDPVSMKEKG